jgi:hypothetical protein
MNFKSTVFLFLDIHNNICSGLRYSFIFVLPSVKHKAFKGSVEP